TPAAGRRGRATWKNSLLLFEKWIDEPDAGRLEMRAIARRDGQVVDKRRRCDQAVLDGYRVPRATKRRNERRPAKPCFRVPRHTVQPLDTGLEPLLQPPPLLAIVQHEDAEANLAQDDRIDDEVTLVAEQPRDTTRVRRSLGDLAEHVRVDQKFQ